MRTASKTGATWITTAILVAFVLGTTGGALFAESGAPTDFEVQGLAPKDGDDQVAAAPPSEVKSSETASSSEPAAESDGRSKEVYAKNVDRVKRIKSLFSKLREQVEVMNTASTQIASLPDLPPEAMDIDQAPMPNEGGSVLDEVPVRAKGKRAARGQHLAGAGRSTYRIQKGDTLARIAKKLLGSSKKAALIAKANGITASDLLKIGRELTIPGASHGAGSLADANLGDVAVEGESKEKSAKGSKSKAARTKNPASEPVLDYSNYEFKMYVIKPGDSIAKIAKAFYEHGGGLDLIRKYNKLGTSDGKVVLKPGEKLLIPLPKKKASDDRYEKAKKGVF